jgi:hypothetical protein
MKIRDKYLNEGLNEPGQLEVDALTDVASKLTRLTGYVDAKLKELKKVAKSDPSLASGLSEVKSFASSLDSIILAVNKLKEDAKKIKVFKNYNYKS